MIIQAQGSLELVKDGKNLNVRFADWYGQDGESSLKAARMWHKVGPYAVNGSQAVTIRGWYDAHLQDQFREFFE